jgi:hypothetical protein
MSAKRRAALAEQGNSNPFSTLTNGAVGRGSAPRLAAPAPRRPRDTGPDAETVALVWSRDHGRCVRCGGVLAGTRGFDWSMQHRRARQGTDRRPDTNQPTNLILLCGSATTRCHGHVESFRAEARQYGWAIRQNDDPAVMPVLHALHGWVLLAADGTHTAFSPNQTTTEVPA